MNPSAHVTSALLPRGNHAHAIASREQAHATRAYRAPELQPLRHTPPLTPLEPSILPTHAHLLPVIHTGKFTAGEPVDPL